MNLANINDWTPLHAAVSKNNVEIVKALVGRPEIELDAKSKHARTAEELAEEAGNWDILAAIRAAKRNREIVSQNFIKACKVGDLEKVKETIGSVDINYQDEVHKNTGWAVLFITF